MLFILNSSGPYNLWIPLDEGRTVLDALYFADIHTSVYINNHEAKYLGGRRPRMSGNTRSFYDPHRL